MSMTLVEDNSGGSREAWRLQESGDWWRGGCGSDVAIPFELRGSGGVAVAHAEGLTARPLAALVA